jgi:hypothetical protein
MKRAPSLGALIFSAAAAVCAAVQLNDVPADGSTAKAVAMGAGVVMILFGGVAGWICGASARRLALAGKPRHARSVVYLSALMLALFCGMFWFGHGRARRYERNRTEALSPERVRELIKGSLEDVRSVAYNRSCPPEILTELAKSSDESTRCGVAANPNTPPAVVDELAKDPSEAVRYYVSFHPSRRKP